MTVARYIRPGLGQLPSMELGNFVASIQAFTDKSLKNVDKAIRKMVFEVFKRIVMRTPRDTGRAAAGWMCGSTYSPSSELGGSPTSETVRWKKVSGKGNTTAYWEGQVKTVTRMVSSTSERGVGSFIGAQVKAGAGTFDKSGSSTISQGASFIKGMDVVDGTICYIFNNVRYIVFLEGGRVYPSPPYGSPQAPQGMVRITLAEFGGIADEIIANIDTSIGVV